MNDIKSYIILNRKTNLTTKMFIYITIIIFITLLILSQLEYKKYYQTKGQVIKENNMYKITLYIPLYKLEIIKNNNKLTIDNQEYIYQLEKIDNKYTISNDQKTYLQIILNINLKEEDKIINNNLNIKILESNKKIICYIKDYLKKGEI